MTTSAAKRYFVFSRAAFARTGNLKPLRRAATRDEARAHKGGNTNYGIWDTLRGAETR